MHLLKFDISWLKLNERCQRLICYCFYFFSICFIHFFKFFVWLFSTTFCTAFPFLHLFASVCFSASWYVVWTLNCDQANNSCKKHDTNTGSFDVNSFRDWNVLWCGTNSTSDAFVVIDMFVAKMTETCKSTMVTNSELVGLGSKFKATTLVFSPIIVRNGRSNKCAVVRWFSHTNKPHNCNVTVNRCKQHNITRPGIVQPVWCLAFCESLKIGSKWGNKNNTSSRSYWSLNDFENLSNHFHIDFVVFFREYGGIWSLPPREKPS